MTIVLPITTDTAHLAIKSLSWAVHLIGKFDASCILVPHVSTDASTTVEALRDIFTSIEVLPTHQTGPANVFDDVQAHFKRTESSEPWLFWQSDWTLLRPDFKELMVHYAIKPGQAFQPKSLAESMARMPVMQTTEHTTFNTLQQVHAEVDFRYWIHRGCMDGSLIARLEEERNSTLTNVPIHEAMEYFTPTIREVPGRVRILIVSHRRDFDWLVYALRSIHKFTTGFDGVTVAVPTQDHADLQRVLEPYAYLGWNTYLYDEINGKGMIQHEERICTADEISPTADWVTHVDSDNVFIKPTHASQFFDEESRPYWVWRPYASLIEMKGLKKVVGDNFQWKATVDRALGGDATAFTMTRHGTTIPVGMYREFRDKVSKHTGKPFRDYVLNCRSSFPQEFCEFGALGAYAFSHPEWKTKFAWRDCTTEPIPDDFIRSYWSHAPLRVDQPVGEGFFNGSPLMQGTKPPVRMTARQEIENLLT